MTKPKRTYDPMAHEKRTRTIREARDVILTVASIFATATIIALFVTIVSPSGYQEFQANYEECLAVGNFTYEQCYGIAYANALGE